MKKKLNLTESDILLVVGIFIASLAYASTSSAQNSYEVMCRSKAKELAAETYKGCMTEYRQAEVEKIRKDYKAKLNKLKSHYDEKLKKLSGESVAKSGSGTSASMNEPVIANEINSVAVETKPLPAQGKLKEKQRASGARMPIKKQAAATQVIDLSQPVDSQINPPEDGFEAARVDKRDSSENNEVEIVEQPSQE